MLPTLLLLLTCAAAPPAAPTDGYLRLAEDRAGIELSIAVRVLRFQRQSGPPTIVSLVGVVHIGEEPYYDALQAYLDSQDVVLFEHVREELPLPDGAADLTPAARSAILATYRRIDALLATAARHHASTREVPTIPRLLAAAKGDTRRMARCGRIVTDAWGSAFALVSSTDDRGHLELEVTSLGADGRTGGSGAASDLSRALDGDASGSADGDEGGIQRDLASAMDLVFQLDAIDYTGAQWRNSDMSMPQLEALLARHGAETSPVLEMLDGRSLMSRFASGFLRLVGATKTGRGMLQLVGVEVLARADELLAAQIPGFDDLFEILIERRNDVVIGDLQLLLEDEPDVQRVAVFYGAGHMPDLEARLVDELDAEPVDTLWFPALRVRFADTGMTRSEISLLRKTIGKTLDQQLKAAGRGR